MFYRYESSKNPYEFTKYEVLDALDSITIDDVKDCHHYLINNSKGIVTANTPADNNDVKDYILETINSMPNVEPNVYKQTELFKPDEKVQVLTKANNNSQADIVQSFTFEYSNNLKDAVTGELMNTILNSSSIGLFDNLREKQNRAYSVHSEIAHTGNRGELLLNILTTTDNKEIGEIKYDNIQKSINGFNNQIQELLNGNFNDNDLECAKKALKADLFDNEGRCAKLNSIDSGLHSKFGISYVNKMYSEIDNITKDDILTFARKVFSHKPIYSIVASQDTLKANEDYFGKLKQD